MATTAEIAAEKAAAKKAITDSARNFLTCQITLPLGNPALKKVHTNQFLFTALPKEFGLKNWETIANALNSADTRFADYTVNRWYIEGVNITVEAQGKAEMQLDLNAFASSTSEYSEGRQSYEKAYQDNLNKNNSNNTSSTKNTSNAVASGELLNQTNIKKYDIPSAITNVLPKICKASDTDEQKAKAWYKWMDANVGYDFYTGHKYTPTQVINRRKGNCVDNSRVYRLGCLAMGIKCNYMHGISCCAGGECANHQWNKVYINGKGIEVDCGRQLASWGSHWGRCSGGTSETTNSW